MRRFLFVCKRALRQIFLYPTSHLEGASTDYDAYWLAKRGNSLGRISAWQRQRAEILLSHIDKQTPLFLVDIGCGDGAVLKYVMERANVVKAVGVDSSSLALQKARAFGIETIKVDIQDMGYIGEIPSGDYIMFFEVLEHVQDSELLLGYMFDRAKKGVFFSFPNTGFIIHRLRFLFGKFPLQWRLHPREHVRFWTFADLRWWLKALGYKHYNISTYEGVPLLNRLWPSLFAAGFLVFLKKTTEFEK